MKKFILFSFCLVLAACSNTAEQTPKTVAVNQVSVNQNAATIEQTPTPNSPRPSASKAVSVSLAKPLQIKAGSSAEAEFALEIQTPFHVNSNPPSEEGFIPLEIVLANSQSISAGKPVYPKGEPKNFAFSADKPVSVYSGAITIKVPIKTTKNSVAGEQELKGKLIFQPCDESVCYRPQTIDVAFPVTIN